MADETETTAVESTERSECKSKHSDIDDFLRTNWQCDISSDDNEDPSSATRKTRCIFGEIPLEQPDGVDGSALEEPVFGEQIGGPKSQSNSQYTDRSLNDQSTTLNPSATAFNMSLKLDANEGSSKPGSEVRAMTDTSGWFVPLSNIQSHGNSDVNNTCKETADGQTAAEAVTANDIKQEQPADEDTVGRDGQPQDQPVYSSEVEELRHFFEQYLRQIQGHMEKLMEKHTRKYGSKGDALKSYQAAMTHLYFEHNVHIREMMRCLEMLDKFVMGREWEADGKGAQDFQNANLALIQQQSQNGAYDYSGVDYNQNITSNQGSYQRQQRPARSARGRSGRYNGSWAQQGDWEGRGGEYTSQSYGRQQQNNYQAGYGRNSSHYCGRGRYHAQQNFTPSRDYIQRNDDGRRARGFSDATPTHQEHAHNDGYYGDYGSWGADQLA